jgi:DNA-binding transcriptional LysR family regulator
MAAAGALVRPTAFVHAASIIGAMHKSLSSLDVDHLRMLHTLLEQCSVTTAAKLLGQTQPRASKMLHRLRAVFGDQLLVRSGAKMVLTERATQLRSPLTEILSQLTRLESSAEFDPKTSDLTFRLACTDCLPPDFLMRLVASLCQQGPGIRVQVRMLDARFDVAQALEVGTLDVVVSNWPNPRPDLRIAPMYKDAVVCLMRHGHPFAQVPRIPLAKYLTLKHLAPYTTATREAGPVDGQLAKSGYRRDIVATVPEFNQAPYVLLETDLVFTTGRRFAEYYAAQLPLTLRPAPSEFGTMDFYMLWHDRNQSSPANRWLRQRLTELGRSS